MPANLNPAILLRPYQHEAVARFLYYRDSYPERQSPAHLLFHMATGSGKTVIMAALIVELYARGHRNFLFFVNSAQIIEKTKANFLDPASSKYLFADPIRFDGRPVSVREVRNFEEAEEESINIHFTTIQGLHTSLNTGKSGRGGPSENGVTYEDFAEREVVLISDEAHHLNAETLANPGQGELELRASWESTVNTIFRANTGNLLLEFTATANLDHPAIVAKYRDKILYDYSLRQFRADRYSKEIELRRADVSLQERMLQAVVLSQSRRKRAGEHGLALKPVVMFKSRRVADSDENEAEFHALIEGLNGERVERMTMSLPAGDTIGDALRHILGDRGITPTDFAREIRLDFEPAKVRNVNRPEDLQRLQIELNSLEDRDNEVRAIFAVDKLNEGWDVLNLFDIVRLYDQGTNSTTNQEAQLIGRGARYWPFTAPDRPDEPREQRKYDADENNPLRVIEQLHYHCTHNPAYVADIRKVLIENGLIDADTRKATIRAKQDFRQSDFFQDGIVFANQRRCNPHNAIFALKDYEAPGLIRLTLGHSGRVMESGAFDREESQTAGEKPEVREMAMTELGQDALRHALDANPFFRFDRLRRHLPKLKGMADFRSGMDFVGGIRLEVRGPPSVIDLLSAENRLTLARQALNQIELSIAAHSHDHVGMRDFRPQAMPDTIGDRTI